VRKSISIPSSVVKELRIVTDKHRVLAYTALCIYVAYSSRGKKLTINWSHAPHGHKSLILNDSDSLRLCGANWPWSAVPPVHTGHMDTGQCAIDQSCGVQSAAKSQCRSHVGSLLYECTKMPIRRCDVNRPCPVNYWEVKRNVGLQQRRSILASLALRSGDQIDTELYRYTHVYCSYQCQSAEIHYYQTRRCINERHSSYRQRAKKVH